MRFFVVEAHRPGLRIGHAAKLVEHAGWGKIGECRQRYRSRARIAPEADRDVLLSRQRLSRGGNAGFQGGKLLLLADGHGVFISVFIVRMVAYFSIHPAGYFVVS